jgi:hypothetical protein
LGPELDAAQGIAEGLNIGDEPEELVGETCACARYQSDKRRRGIRKYLAIYTPHHNFVQVLQDIIVLQ